MKLKTINLHKEEGMSLLRSCALLGIGILAGKNLDKIKEVGKKVKEAVKDIKDEVAKDFKK